MSHSVFKEQFASTFCRVFTGLLVEAADNLSNTLIKSTALLKKDF
jgi:hypothetical protein